MKHLAWLALVSLFIPFGPVTASSECYADPVYTLTATGVVDKAAFVRSGACTTGTTVLGTVAAGDRLPIIMETDQWYLIQKPDGTKGWVWNGLMHAEDIQNRVRVEYTDQIRSVTQTQTQTQTQQQTQTQTQQQTQTQEQTQTQTQTQTRLRDRVRGWILLQVEEHGEAWYVDPVSDQRYYMKDGPTAYEMMRKFGLGVSEADYAKMLAGDYAMKNRLRGRIMLRVQEHGEAYYIHPETLALHYLKDGAEAYRIMRELSLGITNADLATVPAADFVPVTTPTTSTTPTTPANIDLNQANQYWLTKVNALRANAGLRLLVLDQRWVGTASEWAAYMGENNSLTHTRADGKTMHQWIDSKGLAFTERYSAGGWETNYFTENIAWGYTDNSQAGMQAALDEVLAMYLGEASYDGAHYRTIYHADWNSEGAGFYFAPAGEGRYKVFMAFHYGSLEL